MNAGELFKAGKLQEAIDAQIKEVKSHPAEQTKRMFLFEMLAFSGDLDRARKQLDVLASAEVELESARQQYLHLLDAESRRRRVFSEGLKPQFLSDPPDHVKLRLEAIQHLRDKNNSQAKAILAQANQAAPKVHGKLNGKAFAELCDYDDRFGTVLEVMFKGMYGWVPLEQVATLAANPPRLPRDLLWFPARLELHDGTVGEVFLPALYPDSHLEADEQIKLGYAADWKTLDDGPTVGVGQHQFLAGEAPIALLAWRELTIS